MDFETVISHFGTQQKAAAALGINQSSVAAWRRSGIPLPRQYQIEVVSGGALKVSSPSVNSLSEVSAPQS